MQSSLLPTQTTCLCSVLTLGLAAIIPQQLNSYRPLGSGVSLSLQERKMAFKYLQRLHSLSFGFGFILFYFFTGVLLYSPLTTVKCHTWDSSWRD